MAKALSEGVSLPRSISDMKTLVNKVRLVGRRHPAQRYFVFLGGLG
jgi:hypothetical protein